MYLCLEEDEVVNGIHYVIAHLTDPRGLAALCAGGAEADAVAGEKVLAELAKNRASDDECLARILVLELSLAAAARAYEDLGGRDAKGGVWWHLRVERDTEIRAPRRINFSIEWLDKRPIKMESRSPRLEDRLPLELVCEGVRRGEDRLPLELVCEGVLWLLPLGHAVDDDEEEAAGLEAGLDGCDARVGHLVFLGL